MKFYILIILVVVVIILIVKSMIKYRRTSEGLDENNLKYYVIQMSSKPDRVENVNRQEQTLGKKINRFEAILGKEYVDNLKTIQEKIDSNITNSVLKNNGELGCYLSHIALIKQIMEKEDSNGYSVIFEDDFNIVDNNADKKINHYIDTIKMDNRNFDLLFLGRCSYNSNPAYKDELYEIINLDDNIVIMCTHGYIIKNKNIEKIYKSLTDINTVLDHKYNGLIKDKTLKAYLIDPPMVNQQNDVISSTIEGHS